MFNAASKSRFLKLLLVAAWPLLSAAPLHAQTLQPYKDNLFAYKRITANLMGGDFTVVEYSKQRDLRDRDKIDEREVDRRYVSMKPKRSQDDYKLKINGRVLSYMGVGKARGGASVVVIYIHGQGGNRFQGMNDLSFGGNFNRIKNLMVRNNGAFISTDVPSFDAKGTQDIANLIADQKRRSPQAKVIVACGSMGNIICWNLIKNRRTASLLGGIMVLGGPKDPGFLRSGALGRNVPLFIGHGSKDSVYDWESMANFFKRIKSAAPNYPAKFTLFETGSHGTPIRMTDWRLVLNWMLSH
ncbi:MAG: alpha/beta hydrolase [Rhodobacteraceae bacterium]|nr:alpha/beta hydrolase [Paracoccaceae bacterium]